MPSMQLGGRRRMALPMVLASALLVSAGVGIASANSVPHPELRINLFVPPATMPADTPFWIGHGFSIAPDELPADSVPGAATFELYVDGSAVSLRKDVEYAGGNSVDSVAFIWYRNFDQGLPAGEHRFEGRWYVDGAIFLELGADVLFE
jgi:hypothetical protein